MTTEERLRELAPCTLDDRRARVCAALEAAGLDRLVVASNGLHMIDAPNPLFHLTGFRSVGPCFAIMNSDGRTRAFGSPEDDAERIARNFRDGGEAADDLTTGLASFVARSAGRAGHVGLDAAPYQLSESVLAALGEDTVAFDDVFDQVTARKTSRELALALEATRIAEAGWRRLLDIAKPGMRECDLALEVGLCMKEQGADDCFLMLNAGPREEAVMPSSERPLEGGDLILCELSPSVGGQFIQICRTARLDAPSRELVEGYDLLRRAMTAGIACVRPGAAVGEACAAIDDHLSAAGVGAYSRPPFIRRRGHGLGAGSIVPGDVAVDNRALFESGMLLVVHPNQFLPQTGYMMCGEPVVVGRDGPIVLSERQARLETAGGGAC